MRINKLRFIYLLVYLIIQITFLCYSQDLNVVVTVNKNPSKDYLFLGLLITVLLLFFTKKLLVEYTTLLTNQMVNSLILTLVLILLKAMEWIVREQLPINLLHRMNIL